MYTTIATVHAYGLERMYVHIVCVLSLHVRVSVSLSICMCVLADNTISPHLLSFHFLPSSPLDLALPCHLYHPVHTRNIHRIYTHTKQYTRTCRLYNMYTLYNSDIILQGYLTITMYMYTHTCECTYQWQSYILYFMYIQSQNM